MWGGYKNQTKVIGYKVNLILRFGIFFFFNSFNFLILYDWWSMDLHKVLFSSMTNTWKVH